MKKSESLKQLLQSLDLGVAVVDADTWSIVFENAKFFQWFPSEDEGNEALASRLPGFDAERARERIDGNRPYTFEVETAAGPRTIFIRVDVRNFAADGDGRVLVQCHNISKEKESAYMLESYSKLSEKNARDLQREKDRVEKLLLNIMPRSVYEEMKDFGTTTPQKFESASVMLLDFVDFTNMSISHDPVALIAELNDIFSAFDRIVELFDCERIKTIGDAYMAVSGIPETNPDHAQNIARVALRMKRYLKRRNAAHPQEWQCRIGINTGPVIGSIVGVQKYVYDIFGPGVNLASRMEEYAEPMTITLCEETYELIKDNFMCSERGEFDIKGFGMKRLYTLESEHGR